MIWLRLTVLLVVVFGSIPRTGAADQFELRPAVPKAGDWEIQLTSVAHLNDGRARAKADGTATLRRTGAIEEAMSGTVVCEVEVASGTVFTVESEESKQTVPSDGKTVEFGYTFTPVASAGLQAVEMSGPVEWQLKKCTVTPL